MRKIFCLIILSFLINSLAYAGKIRIYIRDYTNSEVAYTIKNGEVYEGSSTFLKSPIFTIRGNEIYEGSSNYSPVYTIEDGKVYKKGLFLMTQVYTIVDNKIYEGTKTWFQKPIYTIEY